MLIARSNCSLFFLKTKRQDEDYHLIIEIGLIRMNPDQHSLQYNPKQISVR